MILRDRAQWMAGILLTAAFFLSVFLFYLSPIELGDFWWHLNTGRWIVENGTLPDHDPFTYTIPHDDDLRRQLILKGYWLAQVVLYLSYQAIGFAGPIVFKAAVFTLIYFVLWRNLAMRGLDTSAGLLVLAPIPFFTTIFDEPRPQILSFLGTLLIFHLMETGLQRLRSGLRAGLALWSMPVLMLIWANVHRGYIIGFIIIAVYMLDETARVRRGRYALEAKDYRTFMYATTVSLIACFINPNFTAAFAGNFIDLGSPFTEVIDEFVPLKVFARFKGMPWLLYGTLSMFTLAAAVIFISRRRLRWHHLFLFSGFAFAGIASGRFAIFMLLMSLTLAAQYIPERSTRLISRLRPLWSAALVLVILLTLAGAYDRNFLRRGAISLYYTPVEAADFVLDAGVPPPLLNAFEQGGYLGWRLYPRYLLFVDQRNLDYQTFKKYVTSQKGSYASIADLLESNSTNTIISYMIKPQTFRIPNIVFHSLREEDWQLVYYDRISVVFVRTDANPGIPALDKQRLWDHLLSDATSRRDANPLDPTPLLNAGSLYRAQGNVDEALRKYREALRLDPGNEMIAGLIEELSGERDQEDGQTGVD